MVIIGIPVYCAILLWMNGLFDICYIIYLSVSSLNQMKSVVPTNKRPIKFIGTT